MDFRCKLFYHSNKSYSLRPYWSENSPPDKKYLFMGGPLRVLTMGERETEKQMDYKVHLHGQKINSALLGRTFSLLNMSEEIRELVHLQYFLVFKIKLFL